MSLWQSFRNLSPRTRIALGLGTIVWGTVGLYISDKAEKQLGFEATAEDKEALAAVTPKIRFVDRD